MNRAENYYSPKKSLQYVNATLQYITKLFSWYDTYYVHNETAINPSETSSYTMGVSLVTPKTSQSLTVYMNQRVILHFLHKHVVCMVLECLRHTNVNKLAHTHFYIAPLQKLPQ
jgi:hypothetical protein